MKIFASLFLSLFSMQALGWDGKVGTRIEAFSTKGPEPTKQFVPRAMIGLENKKKFNSKWSLSFKGEVESNFSTSEEPENLYAFLQEGYLEWRKSARRVRLGWNILNWSTLDISSPSQVMHQRIYFQPLDSKEMGSPMLNFQDRLSGIQIEALYIPFQPKGLLPGPESRWLPRKVLINLDSEEGRIVLPESFTYRYAGSEELNHALSHNYGFRVSGSGERLDWRLSFFEGANSSPMVRPSFTGTSTDVDEITIDLDSDVTLRPLYFRTQTSSLGLVYALEEWILRLESSYSHSLSKDPLINPWLWQNGIGVETNYFFGSQTFTHLTQYYRSESEERGGNFASSSYQLFNDSLVTGLRWTPKDSLIFLGSVLFHFPTEGLFALLNMDYKITDQWSLGLSWRDLAARKQGLIKTYEANDHALLSATYLF